MREHICYVLKKFLFTENFKTFWNILCDLCLAVTNLTDIVTFLQIIFNTRLIFKKYVRQSSAVFSKSNDDFYDAKIVVIVLINIYILFYVFSQIYGIKKVLQRKRYLLISLVMNLPFYCNMSALTNLPPLSLAKCQIDFSS